LPVNRLIAVSLRFFFSSLGQQPFSLTLSELFLKLEDLKGQLPPLLLPRVRVLLPESGKILKFGTQPLILLLEELCVGAKPLLLVPSEHLVLCLDLRVVLLELLQLLLSILELLFFESEVLIGGLPPLPHLRLKFTQVLRGDRLVLGDGRLLFLLPLDLFDCLVGEVFVLRLQPIQFACQLRFRFREGSLIFQERCLFQFKGLVCLLNSGQLLPVLVL